MRMYAGAAGGSSRRHRPRVAGRSFRGRPHRRRCGARLDCRAAEETASLCPDGCAKLVDADAGVLLGYPINHERGAHSRVSAEVRSSRRGPRVARVQYYVASTLDGYIAEADDTLDWLTQYAPAAAYDAPEEAPMPAGYQRFYEGVGALVSGSRTYEFVLGEMERGLEWPYSGKPCWVLTSRELPVVESDGADIRLISGAVRE